jgi:hypothetical protein
MKDRQLAQAIFSEMEDRTMHENILFITRLLAGMKPEARQMLDVAFSAKTQEEFVEKMEKIAPNEENTPA